MQGALRAGVCLFMLSGTCVLSAQAQNENAPKADSVKKSQVAKRKAAAPQYKMKEVVGYIYDGATNQPLAGVKVQALNNRFYTALTEEDGKYVINVPEFVDVLYIHTEGFDPTQVSLKSNTAAPVYLYLGHES